MKGWVFRFGPGDGVSSGLGVGDIFLCFRGVGLGDGVGDVFLCLGEAVGDGLGVALFVARLRCLRGAGVGVGSKILLIFAPNEFSAAFAQSIAPNDSAKINGSLANLSATDMDLQYFIRAKSKNLWFYPNRLFKAPKDVSTSVGVTLGELLKNCFVEANSALEIFERKILVRRMRATIRQR